MTTSQILNDLRLIATELRFAFIVKDVTNALSNQALYFDIRVDTAPTQALGQQLSHRGFSGRAIADQGYDHPLILFSLDRHKIKSDTTHKRIAPVARLSVSRIKSVGASCPVKYSN